MQISEKRDGDLAIIRQAFEEESMSRMWKAQTHQDRKCESGEEHSQENALNFL
jgi:hypothetical protein